MLITVHAHTNSKMPRILERDPGIFDIYVSESPQGGKANTAILEALAGYLDVPSSILTLKRGHTSKVKIFNLVQ